MIPREDELKQIIAAQKYPHLFVTISGAHLYGFASEDSDFDLRGTHILPPSEVMGMYDINDTIDISKKPQYPGDIDLDLVTHDIKKFMSLMLKNNGYVLEQLYSPLVVHSSPYFEELKSIGLKCITRNHSHHYLGFARSQWKLFAKEAPYRIKPLLYVFRVLLTGIHLMQTGQIEGNLRKLNIDTKLSYLDDLICRKSEGKEHETLEDDKIEFYENEYLRLTSLLEQAGKTSQLPERPAARELLNDLLLRLRFSECN